MGETWIWSRAKNVVSSVRVKATTMFIFVHTQVPRHLYQTIDHIICYLKVKDHLNVIYVELHLLKKEIYVVIIKYILMRNLSNVQYARIDVVVVMHSMVICVSIRVS